MTEIAIDLHALANQLVDEESFIVFISALAADWREEREIEALRPQPPFSSGALGWENGSIGTFLETAAAWGESSAKGLPHYSKPSNHWGRAAHILLAGKFYK